jgi:uncharacterized membrane protein
MEKLEFQSEVMVLRISWMFFQSQNVDLVITAISYQPTGSDALKNHQLTTSVNMSRRETTHVFCVMTRHKIQKPRSSRSVFRLLEILTMFTHRYHIDTMNQLRYQIFIHVTDQKMVTQSFRFGVPISLISVMISDATLVPEVLKPTLYQLLSCGADQHSQMWSTKQSHSLYR